MFESRHTEVEEIISFSGFDQAEIALHKSTQDYLVKFINRNKLSIQWTKRPKNERVHE